MRRIARAYRTQPLPLPTNIEAPRAKACNRAERRQDRRRIEAPAPRPQRSEWAIARFLRARPAGTAALSAAFRKVLLERARASERKRVKVFPARMPAALSTAQFEALRARILGFGEAIEKIVPHEAHTSAKAPTIVETA